ncbi:MAG: hypothetical protein AAF700_14955, partial [Pseudomonadota bacterium]
HRRRRGGLVSGGQVARVVDVTGYLFETIIGAVLLIGGLLFGWNVGRGGRNKRRAQDAEHISKATQEARENESESQALNDDSLAKRISRRE